MPDLGLGDAPRVVAAEARASPAPEGATSAGAAADAGAPLVDPAAAAAGAWVEVETVVGTRLRGRIFALDTEAGVIALQGVANSATGEPGQQVPGAPSAAISAAAGVAAAAQATAAAAGAGASASAASSAAGKHAAAQVDLHIIRLAAVRSITAAPQDAALNGSELVAPSPLPPLIPIVAMSDEQLRLKEQLAVRAERERNSRIGVGVPPEAQDVFDALAKTLPVAWKGQAIAVMDDVLIDPPYTPASCSLIPKKNASDSTLSRVRKVLEGERRRLGLE
nr:protein with role in RNA processing [Polyrhizophydium stewartii]